MYVLRLSPARPAIAGRWSYFFRGQALHLLFLVAMVPAAWALAAPAAGDDRGLGLNDTAWFWAATLVAIVHQVYVWLGWRSQLGWQVFTKAFGRRDLEAFCAVFFPLLIARPVLLLLLAWVDRGSLQLATWLAIGSGILLLAPSLFTFYSVKKYFGWARAAGGDHFRNEYCHMPLVNQGAFALTGNAMYTLAFLGMWSIALLLKSHLALVAAIFQHGYIWVHYLATEKPDMELLYSRKES